MTIPKNITPQETHALIVGIEEYGLGKHWDLDGPANDAIKFANWLLDRKVKSENIHFFVSPLEKNRGLLNETSLKPQLATQENISNLINSKLINDENVAGDLLYVFWGGHGIINPLKETKRRLLYSDFKDTFYKNIDLSSLQEALRISWNAKGFAKQVFLVDACAKPLASDYSDTKDKELKLESDGNSFTRLKGDKETKEQFVLFAASEYELALNEKGKGGFFSQAIMEQLNKLPSNHLLPDMDQLTQEVEKKLKETDKPKPVYKRFWSGSEEYSPLFPNQRIKIDWREICRKMLEKQQQLLRLRRQVTELKHETQIFVPLGLIQPQPARRKEETPFPDAAEGMRQYELKLEEIAQRYEYQQFINDVIGQQTKNLAIIGEPGAGKSTWLSKIAEYLADNADNTDSHSPICISLSRLDNRTLKDYLLHTWLEEALEFIPSQDTVTSALVADFQQQFKEQRVWLLLDGVDEMKTTENSPLSQLNSQLEGWLTWTRVILTCRLNVWQANPIANFDYYRTLAFSDVQVRDFIQQWYKKYEKTEKRELGEQLQGKLIAPEHNRIFDLVKSPLRLAMLCQSWYFLQGELPETKANLYQRFVDATYEWKKEEFGTTEAQRQQLNKALGNLALEMIYKQISLKEAVIKHSMSTEDFELAERLGWLNWVYRDQETEERVYAFFHLSFAEYFAATVVSTYDFFLPSKHKNKPVKDRKYKIFEPQWKEVILLWLGHTDIEPKQKENFIQHLVNFKDGSGKFYDYRAYFLAAAGIAEFKNYSSAKEIVKQMIDWQLGDCPIKQQVTTALEETDRTEAIAAFVQLLETSESWRAAKSLEKIGIGNENAITALVQLLKTSNDDSTLRQAAKSLEKIDPGNENAITALVQLLKTSKNDSTLRQAAESLAKIGIGNENAITALVQLLKTSKNDSTLRQAAESLGKIGVGNENVITALVQLLKTSNDDSTLRQVAESLGKIGVGNENVITALVQLLKTSNDDSTLRQVAESLGKIGVGNENVITALVQLLKTSNDDSTLRQVAESLGKIGVGNENVITALVQLLKTSNDDSTLRQVAESLGKIGVGNENVITALVQLLDNSSSMHTRWVVATILGEINPGNQKAINALVKVLSKGPHHSSHEGIYWQEGEEGWEGKITLWTILTGLMKIGSSTQNVIEALVQLSFNSNVDDYTRRGAAESLWEIGTRNEIGTHDENAINALVQLSFNSNIDGLVQVLSKPNVDDDTLRSAAKSLGEIDPGNQKAIDALVQLLSKPNVKYYTRIELAQSLRKIGTGNQKAIDALVQVLSKPNVDDDTLRSAAKSLGEIGTGNQKAIDALVQLLFKPNVDDDTLRSAAKSLGEIGTGNQKAINGLVQLLSKPNVGDYTLKSAAESLGEIDPGNQKAIDALVQLLSKPNVGDYALKSAAESLWEIDPGNQKAIDALVQLLLKPNVDDDTIMSAAESLGEIDPGNQKAIDALVQLLLKPNVDDDYYDETTMYVAESLGKIGIGNEKAIDALVQVLSNSNVDGDSLTRRGAAESLRKIGTGNENAINALVRVLSNSNVDDDIRKESAEILVDIYTGNENAMVVAVSKAYLNDHQEFSEDLFKIIWGCSENIPYPQFYRMWHKDTFANPSLDLANLPTILTDAIDNNSELHNRVKLICVDGSKFLNRDNPAAKIYTEMLKSGCPKSNDVIPKDMSAFLRGDKKG